MYSVRDHPKVGFPHSEIFGSKPVRGSPKLIAAYHVLHRLLAPRHPPNALLALDQLLHLSKSRQIQGIRPTLRPVQGASPVHGTPFSPARSCHQATRTACRPTPTSTSRLMLPLNDVIKPRTRRITSRLEPLCLSGNLSTQPSSQEMVEVNGIEPMTSCLQSRRSPN